MIASRCEAFAGAVDTIIRQVDSIGRLIGEFSAFARMPAPVLRDEALADLAREALMLQQGAWPKLSFRLELPADDPVRLLCDGQKVTQALTNLLQNAVDALNERTELPIVSARPVPPRGAAAGLGRRRGRG